MIYKLFECSPNIPSEINDRLLTNQGVRSLSDILHQALISFVHHYSLNCMSRYFHPVGSNIQGDKANARTKLNDLHILSDRVLTDFLFISCSR